MERLTRRNIIGATGAFASGAGAANSALAKAVTDNLSVASDPLPGLVAEHFRLAGISSPPGTSGEKADNFIERASDADADLCARIAATVAISPAGLLAQAEMLKAFVRDAEDGMWADGREMALADTVIAGIRSLTAGRAA